MTSFFKTGVLMSLFTSSHFASAIAHGNDWREAAKAVLEKLEDIKTEGANFNLGFLYITDQLSDDAESILNLFKSVLGIEHWVGANGIGVMGCGESCIDKPAIAAMIGRFNDGDFSTFPTLQLDGGNIRNALSDWEKDHDPMLILAHGDPVAEEDPALALKTLNKILPGFMLGGLSSSRQQQIQFSDEIHNNGISGVVFADTVRVATALSQGCTPIGGQHVITSCDEHTILELDGEKAVQVFEQDLRDFALQKTGKDPDEIVVEQYDIESKDDFPEEFQSLMKGEMHIAFPVNESDQNDYLVRNIIGLDPDEGSITVSQYLSKGETMMFVHRDADTVAEDLSKTLVKLRKRVTDEHGVFEPKGAVYISCAGRAQAVHDGQAESETELIREIIGDIPLCGFYAGGEITNARLYGYTGVLALFL